MLNHQSLKQLAKEIGRPVKDLVALSVGNDPFYAEVPHRQREAEWFAGLWQRFGFSAGVHLRRVHYVLVSRGEDGEPILKHGGKPYENTDNDWAMLDRASLAARYLDLIPLDALVDRRNDEPMIFRPDDRDQVPMVDISDETPDVLYDRDIPELPNYLLLGFEPQHDHLVEVWIEKSTQNDWLVPLCQSRGVNLVVGIGEMSEIRSRELVHRAHETGKPTRIIYMSDFDPAGRSMPVAVARKVEFYVDKFGLDIDLTLRPLILTDEQCLEYRLPRTPIKESEKRKDRFEERFGAGATELDALEALHPGEMRKLVDAEISRYLDPTLSERLSEAKWELKNELTGIEERVLEPHEDEIADITDDYDQIITALEAWEERVEGLWSEINNELEAAEPDLTDFKKPQPREAQEPDDAVLFDSKRDYLTQLDHYHDFQRRWGGRT